MQSFGFPSYITGINRVPFNPAHPYKLFIDINSCFATVEQQYNPKLRGKPIAIAAYTGPSGCIIAPSIEAKKIGIKTGMRVKDAYDICPKIIVMEPDAPKYRVVHRKIREVLETYTPKIVPKSIDEFAIDIEKTPAQRKGSITTAKSIKQDIRNRVGEWITVSIGIAPNIFLAKTASDLEKPDGLQIINAENHRKIFAQMELTDLKGIKSGNASRLATKQIFTVLDLYTANVETLKSAFGSIAGYYWHLRIRGWEIDNNEPETKKSMGNSYAIPRGVSKKENLAPTLYRLTEKTASRLRKEGYKAKGFSLIISYKDGTCWKDYKVAAKYMDETRTIYKILYRLLNKCPHERPIRILAETCFYLQKTSKKQLELFSDTQRQERLLRAVDKINAKFGDFTLTWAEMLKAKEAAPDRIGFGKG